MTIYRTLAILCLAVACATARQTWADTILKPPYFGVIETPDTSSCYQQMQEIIRDADEYIQILSYSSLIETVPLTSELCGGMCLLNKEINRLEQAKQALIKRQYFIERWQAVKKECVEP